MQSLAPVLENQHPLTAYRAERGMSRDDLAAALEVSRMTVWRWETGARRIDENQLAMVVERTGIPAATLRPDLAELMSPTVEADQ